MLLLLLIFTFVGDSSSDPDVEATLDKMFDELAFKQNDSKTWRPLKVRPLTRDSILWPPHHHAILFILFLLYRKVLNVTKFKFLTGLTQYEADSQQVPVLQHM